jgi:dihydrofolate synthase/folylpolyglutamate synthase
MRTLPLKPDAVLDRLMGLHPKLIDLSLDRIERLLDRLGNPHHNLPPVVHVAGTNGKGSTIAFMRACLKAAGYRVHVYTSPHLARFNERIELAGETIADEVLVPILEECETANHEDPITFFEITTVAAFLAFSRHEADIVLLETGLGGRLDATNLITKPALTVITPISIDHQQFLGDTLAEIAAEKAGILKLGVTGVAAEQSAAAAKVIEQQAEAVGAPLLRGGIDFKFNAGADPFTVTVGGKKIVLPQPALPGSHQHQNAALAIAGLKQLKEFTIDDAALAQGLQTVQCWNDKPLYLVFGMLNSKDPVPFLTPLKSYTQNLCALAIPGEEASLSAAEVNAIAKGIGFSATPVSSVAAALDHIVEHETKPSRILICGSLYLAGTVLKYNQ